MVRVKICGITNLEDAKIAMDAGADALGFVFAKSPRKISVSEAQKITRVLDPWVASVGVFVNESPAEILRVVSRCHLTAVQLHGEETQKDILKLKGLKVIKAFRVAQKSDLTAIKGYNATAYLFDAKVNGLYGGTGQSFDWSILKSNKIMAPIIVSGGLNVKNVHEAVRLLRPYGVDVSSGVEKYPGKKDKKLVREFIQNAKKF